MNHSTVFLAAALVLAPAAKAADDIQVREIGPGHFELTVVIEGTTDPAVGKAALEPKANALCGTKHPHWGHYEFEGRQPAAVEPRATASPSLWYRHEITCETSPPKPETFPAVPAAPEAPPTPADEALIRARTEAYLAAKDAGDYAAAHAMIDGSMRDDFTPGAMAASRTPFNASAGPGVEREVIRLTWYDDPAGAPMPGRYVAADYRATFPSGAFYCGYLVWVRQYDGAYLVVREEQGLATPDVVAQATPANMPALRLQLGCRD